MFFLEVLNRIVSILVGLVTLAEKSKPYIKRHKAETEKDPSVCLAAPDGSDDDCLGNRQIRSIQTEGHFGDVKENEDFLKIQPRGFCALK